MNQIKDCIETAFVKRKDITPNNVSPEVKTAVQEALALLDQGKVRVAEPTENGWVVNEWLKKAVLLSFAIQESQPMTGYFSHFYDKVPLKYKDFSSQDFIDHGVRVVPPATVRQSAYIANNVVLMPSYVNVGAYIDSGSLIDTWATIGSCAQIGKNVHISGGVGIGGVLEPLQAKPTIIEDDCFIGARSEIVEGAVVERGSVIAMGVFVSQSTKIYHRETGEVTYGRIPAGSVVVPGTLPAKDGTHSLACAVIVKQVDATTRDKIQLNELLRDID